MVDPTRGTLIRWNVSIPEKTDQVVRTFLAHTGDDSKGDLSRFVDDAVRRRVLDLTVREIKDRNSQYDQQQVLDLIERNGSGIRSRIDAEFGPGLEDYLATLDEDYPRTLAGVIAIYESPRVVHPALPVNPGAIGLHKRNLATGRLDHPGYVRAIENDLPRVRWTVLEIMDRHRLGTLIYPTVKGTTAPSI